MNDEQYQEIKALLTRIAGDTGTIKGIAVFALICWIIGQLLGIFTWFVS